MRSVIERANRRMFGWLQMNIRIFKNIASSPNGPNQVANACVCQLFAQFTDKNIDDLDFWFVHSAVQVVEE